MGLSLVIVPVLIGLVGITSSFPELTRVAFQVAYHEYGAPLQVLRYVRTVSASSNSWSFPTTRVNRDRNALLEVPGPIHAGILIISSILINTEG
jgi:hypothetical protein